MFQKSWIGLPEKDHQMHAIAVQSPETTHGSSTNSLDMVLLLEQIRWNEQRPAWQHETPGTAKDTDMSLTAPNECRSWQGHGGFLETFSDGMNRG